MQCYMSVISQKNWKKCSRNFKNWLKIVNIKCILSKGNVNIKFEREHKRWKSNLLKLPVYKKFKNSSYNFRDIIIWTILNFISVNGNKESKTHIKINIFRYYLSDFTSQPSLFDMTSFNLQCYFFLLNFNIVGLYILMQILNSSKHFKNQSLPLEPIYF